MFACCSFIIAKAFIHWVLFEAVTKISSTYFFQIRIQLFEFIHMLALKFWDEDVSE